MFFQKEQERFSKKTNNISLIGDLFGDKSKGVISDYEDSYISEFKYLNKFSSKLSKRKQEEFYLSVGDINGKYLPMSKKDVMKLIKKHGESISLRDLQDVYKGQIEIVEYFVGKWGWDLKFASKELQNDSKLILLSKNNIKKNSSYAIKRIVEDGFHANSLSYACCNDKNIVSKVMRNAGHWYHQISPNLKKNFDITLAACKNYGGTLSLIDSKKFLKNKQIIAAALLNDPEQMMNVSSRNLDHNLVLNILKKDPTLLEYAPKKFLNNKNLFIELCQINPAVALTPNLNWRYLLDIQVIQLISNSIYYPRDNRYEEKNKRLPGRTIDLFYELKEKYNYDFFRRALSFDQKVFVDAFRTDLKADKIRNMLDQNANHVLVHRGQSFERVGGHIFLRDDYMSEYFNFSGDWEENILKELIKLEPSILEEYYTAIPDEIFLDKKFLKKCLFKPKTIFPKNIKNDLVASLKKLSKKTYLRLYQKDNQDIRIVTKSKILKDTFDLSIETATIDYSSRGKEYHYSITKYKFKIKHPFQLEEYYFDEIRRDFENINKLSLTIKNEKDQYRLYYKSNSIYKDKLLNNFNFNLIDFLAPDLYAQNKSRNLYDIVIHKDIETMYFEFYGLSNISLKKILAEKESTIIEFSNLLDSTTYLHNFKNTNYPHARSTAISGKTILFEVDTNIYGVISASKYKETDRWISKIKKKAS